LKGRYRHFKNVGKERDRRGSEGSGPDRPKAYEPGKRISEGRVVAVNWGKTSKRMRTKEGRRLKKKIRKLELIEVRGPV